MKSMSADLGPCLKPVLSMAQPWELSRNTNGPSSIVFFSLQIVIRNLFQRLTFNFPFYVTSQETTQTIDFSVKISPIPSDESTVWKMHLLLDCGLLLTSEGTQRPRLEMSLLQCRSGCWCIAET